jgi:hypothetical protein
MSEAAAGSSAQDLIVALPLPPQGYDPLHPQPKAEPPTKYGFPPRPDATQDRAAHDFWAAAFHLGTTYVRIDTKPAACCTHAELAAFPGALGGNWKTSRNWSGFVVGALDAQRIAGAAGAWTIPPDDPTTPVEPPLDGEYRYSCWVGVDGAFPFARALPQVGTDVIVAKAKTAGGKDTVTHRGWVQWYAPVDSPVAFPLILEGFPVGRGDRIAAFVTVLGLYEVDLALVNLRDPAKPVAALIRLSTAGLRDVDPTPFRIVGATAEWILERPSRLPDRVPGAGVAKEPPGYPMPDFGSVRFDGLCVQQWDGPHKPGTRVFQSRRALNQISMYEMTGDRAGLRTLTRPKLAGMGGRVRYWNAKANMTPW